MNEEQLSSIIYVIRRQKVMLDSDLAKLYNIETRVFNQAVKRNIDRFPNDFMFELTTEEAKQLQSLDQKYNHGGRRTLPLAFTENGVAMLSSILNSKEAIQINITIMRVFTSIKKASLLENDFLKRIDQLEYESQQIFKIIFQRLDNIDEIILPNLAPARRKIGIRNKKT